MKRLLLDTNVVVWLLLGQRERFSSETIQMLEDLDNTISLSAVTVWEIAIKRSLGKLTIAEEWAPALGGLGLEPMPVTAVHAAAVERLPWHHRDPFDRLLVAQASTERCGLVSADARLSAYGIEVLW